MDRPNGNRLEDMSIEDYRELIRELVLFVKKRTKKDNIPTFDELSQKFDLSYDDLESIGGDNDLTYNVATSAGGAIVDFPRCAYTMEWIGEE